MGKPKTTVHFTKHVAPRKNRVSADEAQLDRAVESGNVDRVNAVIIAQDKRRNK
jgi:hypothetical protein